MKKTVQRPLGRKHKGGWIIQPDHLITALKHGDAVQMGEVSVGTKNLINLIRLMEFPDEELLIKVNGKLEVENIARTYRYNPALKHRQCQFRSPRNRQFFSLCNKAWLPDNVKQLVILKPKKF